MKKKTKKILIIISSVILALAVLLSVAGPYVVLLCARQPEVAAEYAYSEYFYNSYDEANARYVDIKKIIEELGVNIDDVASEMFNKIEASEYEDALGVAQASMQYVIGRKVTLHVVTKPATANPTLTYTTSADTYADVGSETGKEITILGVAEGSATITVTDGTLSDTISVTVTA